MILPSNVASYGSVPLVDLDHYDFAVRRPKHSTLRAWAKLEETDRRSIMFDWATFVIHEQNRNTTLLNDFASAFLLSFEATLQVVQDEKRFADFEGWLKSQAAYDLRCRGLRTLRHLEAHVRAGTLSVNHQARSISRFAHSTTGGTIAWSWRALEPADLAQLRSSKLDIAELPRWNAEAADLLCLGLMRHGVGALVQLLTAAGP
jgi:hypothetical protein